MIVKSTNVEDIQEIFCLEMMFPSTDQNPDCPLALLKAVADPDVMYMHQAMKQAGEGEFITAIQKEVDNQTENRLF